MTQLSIGHKSVISTLWDDETEGAQVQTQPGQLGEILSQNKKNKDQRPWAGPQCECPRFSPQHPRGREMALRRSNALQVLEFNKNVLPVFSVSYMVKYYV